MIKTLIPEKYKAILNEWKNNMFDGYAVKSYAQEGEDLILGRIFQYKKKGFYIDIGAHHPMRFSNTYYFYKMGWRGINIDAMPGSMKLFNKVRPEDINLEHGVSNVEGEMTYFMFREPALNTFSKELSDQYMKNGQELEAETEVRMYPLASILDQYMEKGTMIDFLSIDVEGLEKEVVSSNDWDAYRPRVIVVEVLDFELAKSDSYEVYRDLLALNYKLHAKTMNSLIFISID